jgi:NAD-dependent dihydropyrimidine dehydrogenase PreA subunit
VTELRFLWVTLVQTLLRVLPFPCKTGLVTIGKPGRKSPVLLTGNYCLTVERVKRALRGVDVYLLVANSRGVNVWCAATGGLLTDHDVVSVLKTSGIEALVDHRQVVLPQLAATGIEANIIHKKTGWTVIWGPVYVTAIVDFLNSGLEKTPKMRTVSFPWPNRLEMAVAWAFPISLIGGLLVFPFWSRGVTPLVGLVWGMSLLIFLTFPIYQERLRTRKKSVGLVFFDFGQWGAPVLLWALFMLAMMGYLILTGELALILMLRWGLSSFIVVLVLSLDLRGSTPIYKSGLHEDRLLRIVLDETQCKAAGFCEKVCPVSVFEVDYDLGLATLPRAGRCVQCGACIVQCPFDALYFQGPRGDVITPDTVRRFKLNLLGSRLVGAVKSGNETRKPEGAD